MAARILRAATVVEALPAKWNLTIVVGSLRLSGKNRLQAADLVFEALRSERHLSPYPCFAGSRAQITAKVGTGFWTELDHYLLPEFAQKGDRPKDKGYAHGGNS